MFTKLFAVGLLGLVAIARAQEKDDQINALHEVVGPNLEGKDLSFRTTKGVCVMVSK